MNICSASTSENSNSCTRKLPADNCRQVCPQLSASLPMIVSRPAANRRQATARRGNLFFPKGNLKYMPLDTRQGQLFFFEGLYAKMTLPFSS